MSGDQIRRRALGYRSSSIFEAEFPYRHDGIIPLTERRLRNTIDNLHCNRFFARCTFGRRITYYSIRLDNEQLRNEVVKRKTYKSYFCASRAAQDQVLTAEIAKKRRDATKAVTAKLDFGSDCPS